MVPDFKCDEIFLSTLIYTYYQELLSSTQSTHTLDLVHSDHESTIAIINLN